MPSEAVKMERRVPSEADTIQTALNKYDGVHTWRNQEEEFL